MVRLYTAGLMAGKQVEAGTIEANKEYGVSEVAQDIPQEFYR